jgi:hypothetical protein
MRLPGPGAEARFALEVAGSGLWSGMEGGLGRRNRGAGFRLGNTVFTPWKPDRHR